MPCNSNLSHIENDVFLSACNFGELYKQHCSYAMNGASLKTWMNHVEQRVMPLWTKCGGDGSLSTHSTRMVACALRDYYRDHVNEG